MQWYYQIALLGQRHLEYAPSLSQGFEMIMIRMLAFKKESGAAENKAQENTKPSTEHHETNQEKQIPHPNESLSNSFKLTLLRVLASTCLTMQAQYRLYLPSVLGKLPATTTDPLGIRP